MTIKSAHLPDTAHHEPSQYEGRLGWVGMSGIEVPVSLAGEGGVAMQAPAAVDAYVNLTDPAVRGIHMSRLYVAVDRALTSDPLTPEGLAHLAATFVDSQDGLADSAHVRVAFDYMVRRRALASDLAGWRRYPVWLSATVRCGRTRIEAGAKITYSSTCPCSASLTRSLIQQQFENDFSGKDLDFDTIHQWLGSSQGILATPHSQRSEADIAIALRADEDMFPLLDLIDSVEAALGTPVQTAVKRADEQAFALANGQNLMFCEDACRRMQDAIKDDSRILDYRIRAAHLESLHPHDAVASVVKGVTGGFRLSDGE